MLGLYILAAVLGGGLLLFSILAGSHHDASDATVSGSPRLPIPHGADALQADHDFDFDHDTPGELLLGLFRPRNLIFFLTAFGATGALLTWSGTGSGLTLGLALGMGGSAMLLTHVVFSWIRRSDAAVEALSDVEIEGRAARVVLPLAPGEAGRVACLIADRQVYVTARLASEVGRRIDAGTEVVVVRMVDGVAEVVPFESLELPASES